MIADDLREFAERWSDDAVSCAPNDCGRAGADSFADCVNDLRRLVADQGGGGDDLELLRERLHETTARWDEAARAYERDYERGDSAALERMACIRGCIAGINWLLRSYEPGTTG